MDSLKRWNPLCLLFAQANKPFTAPLKFCTSFRVASPNACGNTATKNPRNRFVRSLCTGSLSVSGECHLAVTLSAIFDATSVVSKYLSTAWSTSNAARASSGLPALKNDDQWNFWSLISSQPIVILLRIPHHLSCFHWVSHHSRCFRTPCLHFAVFGP